MEEEEIKDFWGEKSRQKVIDLNRGYNEFDKWMSAREIIEAAESCLTINGEYFFQDNKSIYHDQHKEDLLREKMLKERKNTYEELCDDLTNLSYEEFVSKHKYNRLFENG